jgi:hypothetical protein
VTSSYLPTAPASTALYYQLDTAQGAWQQATAASGVGTNPASYDFSLRNVPLGVHTVFAYAVYGEEGTGQFSAIARVVPVDCTTAVRVLFICAAQRRSRSSAR